MTEEQILQRIPELLGPALLEPNDAVIALRVSAIQKIVADQLNSYALVAVAHGRGTASERQMVDNVILGFDPTHLSSNVQLTERVAAVSILLAFASGSPNATVLGLLTESANFAGWTPVIAEIAARAAEYSFRVSRQSRGRPELKKQAAPRLATDDLQESVKFVNATSRRLEDVVAALSQRIEVMDEELNILWWARANRTRASNEEWDALSPIARQVAAAFDIAGLAAIAGPPASSMLGILAEKGAAKKAKVDDASILEVAIESVPRLGSKLDGKAGSPLLPVLTATAAASSYASEPASIPGVLRVAQIDPDLRRSLTEVGAQVLRELMLLRITQP